MATSGLQDRSEIFLSCLRRKILKKSKDNWNIKKDGTKVIS
jgi:hypothetical protein